MGTADHPRDYRAEETIVFFMPLLAGLLNILEYFKKCKPVLYTPIFQKGKNRTL